MSASFSENSFIVIGHRGAKGYQPENTLRSIRKALELGCRHIEIDVRAVGNELFLSHDLTEELLTEESRRKMEIPSLNEVLDLIKGKAALNIELKEDVVEQLVPILTDYFKSESYESILLSSFEHSWLYRAKAKLPKLLIAPLYDKEIPSTPPRDAFSINLSKEIIKGKVDFNIPVFVYTVNSVMEALTLKKLGVSGVFSDYPDLLSSDLLDL